jgi:hypothetical protein
MTRFAVCHLIIHSDTPFALLGLRELRSHHARLGAGKRGRPRMRLGDGH